MRPRWLLPACLMAWPLGARAKDLVKISPYTGSFDIYASSPTSTGTVIPSSLNATNSATDGYFPAKAAGLNQFTWTAASGSSLSTGTAMSGGNANSVVYLDSSSKTATSTTFGFNGSTVTAPNLVISGTTTLSAQGQQNYYPAGRLFATATSSSTAANTTLTTLYSYTIPANLLNTAGGIVYVRFMGTTAANSNNKNWYLTVGVTTCSFNVNIADNAQPWEFSCAIISGGTNVQELEGQQIVNASSGSTLQVLTKQVSATETSTAGIIVALKAQNGSSSADISLKSGYGIWYP